MADDDRWMSDRERYGYRGDDRGRWRDEGRREDFGRGGRGRGDYDDRMGRERDLEDRGWGRDYGRGLGEGRGGGHVGEVRGRAHGEQGGFGGYRADETRWRSGRGRYESESRWNDDDRGFYGADQGSDLDAAYRELHDRGDGYVGRDRNYGFSGGEGRGFWRAAADEVRSWFGHEDTDRRDWGRRRDESGEQHHRGRGPRNYARSDERIREDVNDRLTDDPHIDASELEVSVQNREVTLTGTVRSRFEKRHAEDIAESVSGVTHVQNNLRVQTQAPGPMAGGAGVTGAASTNSGQAAGGQGTSPVEVNRSGGTSGKTGTRS
jgi:osmotically-inducible protein OsmY